MNFQQPNLQIYNTAFIEFRYLILIDTMAGYKYTMAKNDSHHNPMESLPWYTKKDIYNVLMVAIWLYM